MVFFGKVYERTCSQVGEEWKEEGPVNIAQLVKLMGGYVPCICSYCLVHYSSRNHSFPCATDIAIFL